MIVCITYVTRTYIVCIIIVVTGNVTERVWWSLSVHDPTDGSGTKTLQGVFNTIYLTTKDTNTNVLG